MEDQVTFLIVSFMGTSVGSILGILAANRLTVYRIQQLEIKVDKHNSLSDRMILVEQSTKSAHKRLDFVCEMLRIGGTE